ncbi:MAG: RluA family pseudouridine synthase [Oscillibacter sp.]
METLNFHILEDNAGRSVRSILRGELHFSARAISRLTRSPTGILVDGVHARTTHLLQPGETLTVEAGDQRTPKTPVVPGPWPIEVVWEDPHLLVLNKPDGMTAHLSNFLPETPTVAGALAWTRGTDFLFHAVNRLDKGTTGLMVVAKSGYVHELFRKALHSDRFTREYRGICIGCPTPRAGTIDLPIGRDETSTVKRKITPDGAAAVTHYEVLEEHGGFSLLRLSPETGRTHQLRLHMSAIGHPLAGDWLYGTEALDLIPRPALHSYALRFLHPVTGEELSFTAPLPEDMRRLLL